MSKRVFVILSLIAALGLCVPALMADHGDKGNKHKHGNKHFDDDDNQGWERRAGYEYRIYGGSDERPPGWNRGNKTGWGNCGMPPGQAKKYGCRTYVYEGHPYYYYEGEGGQIIVRRPVVEIHATVDIH